MKIFNKFLLILITLLFVLSCSSSQQSTSNDAEVINTKEAQSFAVMPFFEPNPYPYSQDILRFEFINALMARGLEIEPGLDRWENLLNASFSLVNLNEEYADSVAQILDVEIIITGEIRNYVYERMARSTTPIKVQNPILIKAYHTKQKKFIYSDTPAIFSSWGMFSKYNSYGDIATDFINQLKHMGYIQ